jgi:signal transduction histidine kinase
MNCTKIIFSLCISTLLLYSCLDDDTDNSDILSGCTNVEACNYDDTVDADDGSCTFICLTETEKQRVIDHVESAILFVDENGEEVALAAFSDDENETFIDEELYIFVFDITNTDNEEAILIAHPYPSEGFEIEDNVYDLQDTKDKYIVQDFIEVTGDPETEGWSWYYWEDPSDNNETKKKFSYVVRIEDRNWIIGAGTYK